MNTLKEVFDEHLKHVKFDSKLAKALYSYQVAYINKNHEHLEFFGGNLLGVQVIRFKDSDVLKMYDEVLDIDAQKLKEDIRKLDTINHTFKVSADIFNLTLMYLLHRFLTATTIPKQVSERAAYDVSMIFFYRCIAALLSDWVRYPFDPKIAQMAYANLSKKFLIKELGSWGKVMDYRAKDLSGVKSIHRSNLIKFTDDSTVVYAINDSQGRIRDLVKGYYSELAKVSQEGSGIATTSSTYMDADGEETIKEKTKSVEAYVSYIRNSIIDKHTFVKDDLVSIIARINTNTSFRMVKHTLNWLSENYNEGKHHKEVDDFLSITVIQSMYLIQNNIDTKHIRDYPHILIALKNLYLSTRTTDEDVDKIRELGLDLVNKANGKVSNSLALATRTSIILYISLRALVGQNG
jgi:hypothetical protein